MGNFEYRDLAPIDNIENGDKYIEALNWAFQNKKVKNIALTGPYGAGKSSVIETFLAQDDEKNNKGIPFRANTIRNKSLKISMATFFKGKVLENDESGEKIEVDADEVEKGILKQLFYKVEPGKIPQSRYRKIHKIKFLPVFVGVLAVMIFTAILSDIFVPEKFSTFVETVSNFLSRKKLPYINTYFFIGILFTVTSGIIAYLYRTVISRFRIKEVKLPSDTTIQSGREESDSVFNKNLDEIMYFFEATGYRIVFFEDLDRLDDPKIFVHLRELNNLLNNDDAIKRKPIVFVYAVRDDIFSKEDRTKFFDFIIPIIPVINETNSGEILLQRLQEAKGKAIEHNISQGFVLDVSPYISDMRVLQNIYNEFVIYKDTLRTKAGKQYYPITCPDGTVLEYDEDGNAISWLRSKARFDSDIAAGEIRIIKIGEKWSVQFKQRIPLGKTPRSIFTTETVIDDRGTTSTGASDVYDYFKKDVFSNPKPVELIRFLLGFGLGENDIVLDFFSGSGTTAEAVMRSNLEGGKNKFILVQLPENIDPLVNSSSANAKRVAENAVSVLDEMEHPHLLTELAKERIRRAGEKIKSESPLTTADLDVGFRVLKLDDTNMKDVYYAPDDYDQGLLAGLESNIKDDRTDLDLLFGCLLDWGLPLSMPYSSEQIDGCTVHTYNDGDLIACFDENVPESVVEKIAKRQPLRVVFRDSGFANSPAKINVTEIFKLLAPDTRVKVI